MIENPVKHMLALARAAADRAYAPYSKFQVGVCLCTENGNFYSGCNIENASYSLANCAEDTAICHMVNAGEHSITEVVVTSSGDEICTPCGACRQRIREFSGPNTLIHMYNIHGDSIKRSLNELLPHSFGPGHLNKAQETCEMDNFEAEFSPIE